MWVCECNTMSMFNYNPHSDPQVGGLKKEASQSGKSFLFVKNFLSSALNLCLAMQERGMGGKIEGRVLRPKELCPWLVRIHETDSYGERCNLNMCFLVWGHAHLAWASARECQTRLRPDSCTRDGAWPQAQTSRPPTTWR